MRKLMMLVAMLAIVLLAALPALAQETTQSFKASSTKSGSASPSVKATNSGKNVSLCPTDMQHVNTGNTDNEQGQVQNKSESSSPSFTGTDLSIIPAGTATCDQTIRQAATAGAK